MTTLRELQARLGTPQQFVARIRRQLYLHNITQRALAEEAGVDYQHLSRWLRERVRPSLPTMLKLDEALTRLLYPKAGDKAA